MILLSGATGFIGGACLSSWGDNGVKLIGRSCPKNFRGHFFKSEFTGKTVSNEAFQDVDVVVHCAAKAHSMNLKPAEAKSYYSDVNVEGTLHFANQAASNKVKRFVFLSSVKVNGESTASGRKFLDSDKLAPSDFYAVSKAEAEQGLIQIGKKTGMEIVIIRPPLVYGPAVKGNFAALMSMASKGLPLPLGAIHNKRSMVSIENLVDLITICTRHPNAANQVFLVSDDHDVSTSELLRALAFAFGKKSLLIPVPSCILVLTARLLGKGDIAIRLVGNLQLDISKTKSALDWQPPVSFESAIVNCVRGVV